MIDITIARITHVQWVHQLEMLLHKNTTAVSLPSYHDCELGVWLYGEGLRTYKSIPEIEQLEQSHKVFHLAADNVIEWHNGSKFSGRTGHSGQRYSRGTVALVRSRRTERQ